MNWQEIFGSGEHLTELQMSVRAFIMFFISLGLIRIGGMRIFGEKTAFDNIIIIMFGAVLARGIVGASPFGSTIAAGATMIIIHRVLGWIAMWSPAAGIVIKGKQHQCLYRNDHMIEKTMKITSISENDLKEAVREILNEENFDNVKTMYMENNGKISVIKKK
jgi:uncharacterized membrane protein YcaP (DUF421 family)